MCGLDGGLVPPRRGALGGLLGMFLPVRLLPLLGGPLLPVGRRGPLEWCVAGWVLVRWIDGSDGTLGLLPAAPSCGWL